MGKGAKDPRKACGPIGWLNGGALIMLALFLMLIEWGAERFVLTGMLLYGPPWFYLIVPCCFAGVALFRRRWSWLGLNALAVVAILFLVAKPRFGSPAPMPTAAESARTLSIVTHNVGQGNRDAFDIFFGEREPDVIALQDAARRGTVYRKRFPEFNVREGGQFVLLTRHPVQNFEVLSEPVWKRSPVAMRVEVKLNDRWVALYNIHFPTPRNTLSGFFRPRSLLESVGIGASGTDGMPSYREWLDARIRMARIVAARARSEAIPSLLVGDFNTPAHGIIYHEFAGSFTDAFAARGSGFGFTFPGTRDGMVARFGPWLRLDYIFASSGWQVEDCEVAPDAKSQHRALYARLRLMPGPAR
jgi:endonuclease/exonuclease/phosphatase (EEP) superfamily protein YafD